MTTFQIWQIILGGAGVFAAVIGALYMIITRPILAYIGGMQTSINSRLDSIDRRLDRIENKLDSIDQHLLKFEERITRLEERTSPLRH